VSPAIWGVGRTCGLERNEASGGGGSGANASTAARISPASARRQSVSWSTTAIRVTRTKSAPAGSASITLRLMRPWVAGVGGMPTTKLSLSAARSTSEVLRSTPLLASASSATNGS
jgi:hypothetical protein